MSNDPLAMDRRLLDLENTTSQLEEFQVAAKESSDKNWHSLVSRIHYLDEKAHRIGTMVMGLEEKYNEAVAYISLLEQRINDLAEKSRSYGDRSDQSSETAD